MTERKTAMQQQLAAERPLDVQVSTRVMGWHLSHDGLNYRWTDDQGDRRKYITEDSWSPSTSIADAWEVVTKMREDGWVFEFDNLEAAQTATFWRLDGEDGGRWVRKYVLADTAPLAICLAAIQVSALSSFPDSTKEGE